MTIASYSMFDTYKEKINSLTPPTDEASLLTDQFLLEKDPEKHLEIYYAPFEYINENAKVVIVGITPGLHQMKKTFSTVWKLKDEAIGDEKILQEVKKTSSFEGPMRKNLIAMLDELGLHKYLGISSSTELFGQANDLIHTTSVLPYPVFYKGKNYSGSTPSIVKTELFRKYLTKCFPEAINKSSNPLIIPLGVNVTKALNFLAENEYIPANPILNGFPHPSGSNGHRHRQFAVNKEEMKRMLEEYFNNN
ncbi:hypothetical protein [Pseudalkalibacillus caeni]|uniref:Uracil-DNA glycosylase-like domain-containing protein n=1 Tax=Exobacillus caeni TaxID=2574798 RepID=A0A5R9EYW1_9BACL|nr:hypothetical protein [Pseudalkalibacillus caeni]TLS36482.1 hypothetical protein FCL54_14800 [Pseudalkalibacillus caeni]